MKRLFFLPAFLVLIGFTNTSNAQDVEVGVLIGTSNYQGDLSQNQVTLNETQPAFGGIFRYYFNPRLNFKANVYWGWMEGSDRNYQNWRDLHNLSFRSHILDISGQLEVNLLPFISGTRRYSWAPYLFTGFSVFNFNPKAQLNGKYYALQPLGTEGQNASGSNAKYPEPYSLTQVALVPLGVGVKIGLGGGWNIGVEFAQRKTFTDYLDDVSGTYADPGVIRDNAPSGKEDIAVQLADPSNQLPNVDAPYYSEGKQRGNPDRDDWYLFGGLTITYTIRKNQCMGF